MCDAQTSGGLSSGFPRRHPLWRTICAEATVLRNGRRMRTAGRLKYSVGAQNARYTESGSRDQSARRWYAVVEIASAGTEAKRGCCRFPRVGKHFRADQNVIQHGADQLRPMGDIRITFGSRERVAMELMADASASTTSSMTMKRRS